jgi:hypothetical protein
VARCSPAQQSCGTSPLALTMLPAVLEKYQRRPVYVVGQQDRCGWRGIERMEGLGAGPVLVCCRRLYQGNVTTPNLSLCWTLDDARGSLGPDHETIAVKYGLENDWISLGPCEGRAKLRTSKILPWRQREHSSHKRIARRPLIVTPRPAKRQASL